MTKLLSEKIIKSLKDVYSRPIGFVITIVVIALVMLLGIGLVNLDFIKFTLGTYLFSSQEKVGLLFTTFNTFRTAIPVSSQIGLVFVAIFSGINIAFFSYFVKRRIKKQHSAGVGFLGIIGGFLGVGCGACGSVLLSSIFGVTATSQIIGILPFDGFEFTILGILILIASTIFLAKKIQDPEVCRI